MIPMRREQRSLFAAVALAVLSFASSAFADRVVVFTPGGTATDSRRQEVEAIVLTALRDQGHEVIRGNAIQRGTVTGTPSTEADMVTVATANHAEWVIASEVAPLAGQYRWHVTAGYTVVRRIESIDVNVVVANEEERIRDVVRSLIRAAGLGDDALRLSEDDPHAATNTNANEEAEEAARREREEAARLEQEAIAERERAHAAEEAAAREHDFENRARYGADAQHPWIGQAGLGMISLASHDNARSGGFLWNLQLRFGHGFVSAPGLELRGGIDIVGGAASGFSLNVGAVYLGSFFSAPVYIGGSAELGFLVNTTGARDVGLLLRASGAVSWRVSERFYLEGLLPEITYASIGGDIVGIGLSVRAGYRF